MKNMENIPEDFFDLLSEKPFELLSEQEKQKVLALMTEDDYRSYWSLVHDFQALDDALLSERSNVQDFFEQKDSLPAPQAAVPTTATRIPFYQWAATFVLLITASVGIRFMAGQSMMYPSEQLELSDSLAYANLIRGMEHAPVKVQYQFPADEVKRRSEDIYHTFRRADTVLWTRTAGASLPDWGMISL